MPAPEGLNTIPAMTTDAERELYYRLAFEGAGKGEIVELGAWMGASTAYIAAGIRDSGYAVKAKVYDKFQSKAGHVRKVAEFYSKKGIDKVPIGPCVEQFRENLGPLFAYVDAYRGQIEDMVWTGGNISVLITDAPKRVPAISAVMTTLREALQPGAIMAWQDFCHFPSYEIPACLYRLRDHIEFVEAVVPGTTLAFRVTSQWTAEEVSREALALHKWTPDEIATAWAYWLDGKVPAEKAALFRCGAAMFLCDIGHKAEAAETLKAVRHFADVEKKWDYLRRNRADFVTRYAPLFDVMAEQETA
jgi:hypothetical protein